MALMEENRFYDEKILEYRNRARKEKFNCIETGMYIQNELVKFERIELFEHKLSFMIPDTFVDLPPNLAKAKYSSEQRPQIIKTSLNTTVNIGFSILPVDISAEQIKNLVVQAKKALKRLNPALVFYESKVEMKSMPLGWFEFKSYGLDSNVYNLMFITRIDGKMVHGIFNCKFEDAIEWREAARQIAYSVRDTTKENEKNAGTKNNSGTI